jgi:hypothetical protein
VTSSRALGEGTQTKKKRFAARGCAAVVFASQQFFVSKSETRLFIQTNGRVEFTFFRDCLLIQISRFFLVKSRPLIILQSQRSSWALGLVRAPDLAGAPAERVTA